MSHGETSRIEFASTAGAPLRSRSARRDALIFVAVLLPIVLIATAPATATLDPPAVTTGSDHAASVANAQDAPTSSEHHLPTPPVAGAVLVEDAEGRLSWYAPHPTLPGRFVWQQGLSDRPVESGAGIESSTTWLTRVATFSTWLFFWGLLGQMLFMSRFAIQWFVSERAKKSVVPQAFWWLSLGGSIILLSYFAARQDPIGILGQSIGWVIYTRNLVLIYRERRRQRREDGAIHDADDSCPPEGVPDGAAPLLMPQLNAEQTLATDAASIGGRNTVLAQDRITESASEGGGPRSRMNGTGGGAPGRDDRLVDHDADHEAPLAEVVVAPHAPGAILARSVSSDRARLPGPGGTEVEGSATAERPG